MSRHAFQTLKICLASGIVAASSTFTIAATPIGAKVEPIARDIATKASGRDVLVLTLTAADTQTEPWGVAGVVYDELAAALVNAGVRVRIAPKLDELIARRDMNGPLKPSDLKRVRTLATFDLLLDAVYRRRGTERTIVVSLRQAGSDDPIWTNRVTLAEQDVRAADHTSEINRKIVEFCLGNFGKQVGDGECWTLAAKAQEATPANRTAVLHWGRKLGALDSPLPGDIVRFEEAVFKGKGGSRNFRHHTAVVESVQSPTIVGVLHQNVGKAGKTVSRTTLHLHELRDGLVELYRSRPKVLKAIEPRTGGESPLPGTETVSLSASAALGLRPIPAGKFRMGKVERYSVIRPTVTLTKPFYLGTTEVTQAQWTAVMGENPAAVKGDDLPVTNVSWDDAQKFMTKLNASPAGKRFRFRLPTDAEWEYACRAGTELRYSFGDDGFDMVEYGWYADNAADRPRPVGRLRPNAWGLHDMHGNAWELIQDVHSDAPLGDPPQEATDPAGPASGKMHVKRGGCYGSEVGFCSAGNRGSIGSKTRSETAGFRLAAEAK